MIHLRDLVCEFLRALLRYWDEPARHSVPMSSPPHKITARLEPLQQVILSRGVERILFSEYEQHRQTERGHEETGWLLLGVRSPTEAIVMATIPAGSQRKASDSHVQFDSEMQEFVQRIVRQEAKQLRVLGIVHTHPGSLRHPSSSDYRGDICWVVNLLGQEGVFGIGTVSDATGTGVPETHVQQQGVLRFDWYALKTGDRNYRPIPVTVLEGPDLAEPLRKVWSELEEVAERLNPLLELLPKIRFDVVMGRQSPALLLTIRHPRCEKALQIQLEGSERRYFLTVGAESQKLSAPDATKDRIDRVILQLLGPLLD